MEQKLPWMKKQKWSQQACSYGKGTGGAVPLHLHFLVGDQQVQYTGRLMIFLPNGFIRAWPAMPLLCDLVEFNKNAAGALGMDERHLASGQHVGFFTQ